MLTVHDLEEGFASKLNAPSREDPGSESPDDGTEQGKVLGSEFALQTFHKECSKRQELSSQIGVHPILRNFASQSLHSLGIQDRILYQDVLIERLGFPILDRTSNATLHFKYEYDLNLVDSLPKNMYGLTNPDHRRLVVRPGCTPNLSPYLLTSSGFDSFACGSDRIVTQPSPDERPTELTMYIWYGLFSSPAQGDDRRPTWFPTGHVQ